jgi:DNA-binding CsgD family transcriptional regulator
MLVFAAAPVFANMQGALFTNDVRLFGMDAMTLMGAAYCIGAGVIFAFTSVKNMVTISRISVIMTLAGFIPWLFLPESQLSLSFAILFMFGFGGCGVCAVFSYTFALNNAERLFGAAIISAFCMLMEFDYGISFISGLFGGAYLTMLVVGTVICLLSYKTEDFDAALKKPEAKFNPAITLMLYFFVAHKFVEILYTYFPVASTPEALIYNGIVGLLVIGLSLSMQVWAKRSIWNMCNLFFIAMIVTYALYFTPDGSAGREVSRLFHGFEQMGFIASYYLVGCVFKKHGNFRLFKRSFVIIAPSCLLLYVIPGVFAAFVPDLLTLVSTAITGVIFIVFFLLSPAYSRHLFYADWSDDFTLADMRDAQAQVEQTDNFESLDLTPREKEVAAFLLQGYGTKQVAGELGIKIDTAKFHVKNLYKKLDIESKAELFARFSVELKNKVV